MPRNDFSHDVLRSFKKPGHLAGRDIKSGIDSSNSLLVYRLVHAPVILQWPRESGVRLPDRERVFSSSCLPSGIVFSDAIFLRLALAWSIRAVNTVSSGHKSLVSRSLSNMSRNGTFV